MTMKSSNVSKRPENGEKLKFKLKLKAFVFGIFIKQIYTRS